MCFWFMLVVVLILVGCSSYWVLLLNFWLVDFIMVVVNLNEQLCSWCGVLYCYGGMMLCGVDCFGFVVCMFCDKFVFQLLCEICEQVEIGICIDKCDLLFGDLVFFKIGLGESGLYVGIYDIDNQFIYVFISQGVICFLLDNVYWNKKFWQVW